MSDLDSMVLARLGDLTPEAQARVRAEREAARAKARALKEIRGGGRPMGNAAPSAAEGMRGAIKVVKPPRSVADGNKNAGPLPHDIPIVRGPDDAEVGDGLDGDDRQNIGQTFPGRDVERDDRKGTVRY